MDLLSLDARTLLVAARAVGLVLAAHDGRLLIKGPKGAAGLVRLLQDRKAEILTALTAAESSATPMPGVSPAGAVAGPHFAKRSRSSDLSGWGPPPTDPACHEVVAHWPVAWRERWRRRADELQDRGASSDMAGWIAFNETIPDLVRAEDRGEIPESAYPNPAASGGLSDDEAVAGISLAFGDPAPARTTGHGPRDVRRGDRWLPWHLSAGSADHQDRQERAGIMQFDGELSREEAERWAGLRPYQGERDR